MMMVKKTVESLALRPREAAKALGIGARTLWGLTAPRGPIPCIRIGHGKRRTVLYPVAELQAWLSQQAEAVKGATMTTPVERLSEKLSDTRRAGNRELEREMRRQNDSATGVNNAK